MWTRGNPMFAECPEPQRLPFGRLDHLGLARAARREHRQHMKARGLLGDSQMRQRRLLQPSAAVPVFGPAAADVLVVRAGLK